MFDKFKKKPTDSRVRFQNSRFRRRLSEARGYKRVKRDLPAGRGAIFLRKIGLGSWVCRFATVLVFLFFIYLVFIPNIFFIKDIVINISRPEDKQDMELLVSSYLNKTLPWPQKNLILLSGDKLKNYLLLNGRKILSVNSITKKFPSTLVIDISPRIDQFAFVTGNGTAFSVANDGLATSQLPKSASGTLPSGLLLIKIGNSDGLQIGRRAFTQNQADFLSQIHSRLESAIKSQVDNIELASLQTPDLTIYAQNGFKVKLNLNAKPEQILSRLKLLFSQFADSDLKKLYYVDMRFGDNGYVCYKDTACVEDINLPDNLPNTAPATLKQ